MAALHCVRLGAIAQLGERLDRTQKVAGSSPASSTSNPRFSHKRPSTLAVDGDLERFADLPHTVVAESAQAVDQRSNRDALD